MPLISILFYSFDLKNYFYFSVQQRPPFPVAMLGGDSAENYRFQSLQENHKGLIIAIDIPNTH